MNDDQMFEADVYVEDEKIMYVFCVCLVVRIFTLTLARVC